MKRGGRKKKAREWMVEYEIPPLRAILYAKCSAETEDEVRKAVISGYPAWRIRKITEVLPRARKKRTAREGEK